jgi:hypothetical protein
MFTDLLGSARECGESFYSFLGSASSIGAGDIVLEWG